MKVGREAWGRDAFQVSGHGGVDQSSFWASTHPNSTLELWHTAGTSCANNTRAAAVERTSGWGCLARGRQRLSEVAHKERDGRREQRSGVTLHWDVFPLLPRL